MSTQTLIAIAAVLVAVLVAVFITLYVLSDTFYYKKEERAYNRSVKIRDEITRQANAVKKTLKDNDVDMEETEETRLLEKTLREIGSLSRDGRRSTDKIESLAKQLPELEKNALASVNKSTTA